RVLHQLEALVVHRHRREQRCGVVRLGRARGRVQRRGLEGVGRLEALEHGLVVKARGLVELGRRGATAELDRELGLRLAHLGHVLLHRARDAHGPAGVAEVAPQLAQDRGYCERGEPQAALGVEAVDGLDQAQVRDLEKVLEGLAGVAVAPGQLRRERHEALDELVARRTIVEAVQAQEEPTLLRGTHGVVLGCFYVAGGSDIRSRHDETASRGSPASTLRSRDGRTRAIWRRCSPPSSSRASPLGVRGQAPPLSRYPLPARATRRFQARTPRPSTATATPATMTNVSTVVAGPTRCEIVSRPSTIAATAATARPPRTASAERTPAGCGHSANRANAAPTRRSAVP